MLILSEQLVLYLYLATPPLRFGAHISMERTLPCPIPFQLLHSLFQLLLPLPFKIPRPNIRDTVPSRIIPIPLITRHRPPQSPSQPCCRTPAIPQCGLDIVRCSFPLFEEEALILIRLFSEGRVTQEVRPWRGQVAQKESAGSEDSRENRCKERGGRLVAFW